jgi:Mg/Co/Ni transporter MgtE
MLAITAALGAAGAVTGAVSGVIAMTVAVLVYLGVLPDARLIGLGAELGAAIGALALPLLGWALLRTVPLRAAVIGTSVGVVLGGAAGLLVGAASVNPYVPFTVSRSPFPECAVGAVVGAAVMAAGLRAYARRGAQRRADSGGTSS